MDLRIALSEIDTDFRADAAEPVLPWPERIGIAIRLERDAEKCERFSAEIPL
jgi:hypothetical protein